MTENDWWKMVDDNKVNLRQLILKFHPCSGRKVERTEKITAIAAEAVCENIRQEIIKKNTRIVPPTNQWDLALEERNLEVALQILQDAWFGMPESASVRSEPGFFVLCNLCDDFPE